MCWNLKLLTVKFKTEGQMEMGIYAVSLYFSLYFKSGKELCMCVFKWNQVLHEKLAIAIISKEYLELIC